MRRGGWTYIMASRRRGMTYIGVTADLASRIDQHRRDRGSAYCRRFGIKTLVYAEFHETIEEAIRREKSLKAWRQEWKWALIETTNPAWSDIFAQLIGAE